MSIGAFALDKNYEPSQSNAPIKLAMMFHLIDKKDKVR
jgi:hypothetical protein